MARQRPSFLKRQKEQNRIAKATAKREMRRLKKQGKIDGAGEQRSMMAELNDLGEIVEPEVDEAEDEEETSPMA